ncbi:hypothetical protein [Hahella sp. NBU794]|uniref:hypothetical protein n=1 Tax=Hahella sp. NBU794 TaxID=3422590 RepID=UPI003D6DD10E
MKKKISITIILIFALSLLPCVSRTWKLASDAYGLVILATLNPNEMTYNPYSKDGLFINPEIALHLLEKFEYPYRRCSSSSEIIEICNTSLITWVGRALDMHGPVQTERGYRLLSYFISRGEDVNKLTDGMAPVHEAILFRNAKYLKVLLDAGASLDIKIERSGREYDGFNALQYLELLESKKDTKFNEIRKIIQQVKA